MTRRTSVMAGVGLAVGLGLLAVGCTRGSDTPPTGTANQSPQSTAVREAPAGSQELSIAFRSEPDPPQTGDNMLEVMVQRADGSPVTDAAVATVFSMPAMPSMNMPAMRSEATLSHEASGRYRGTGRLSMGGTWNVTVTVSRGPQELGRKNFSVVAK